MKKQRVKNTGIRASEDKIASTVNSCQLKKIENQFYSTVQLKVKLIYEEEASIDRREEDCPSNCWQSRFLNGRDEHQQPIQYELGNEHEAVSKYKSSQVKLRRSDESESVCPADSRIVFI